MRVLILLTVFLISCGGGSDGKDGKDGSDGKDGTNLEIINSVFCQVSQQDNFGDTRIFHVEWTNFSDDSRFIKCFASWSPGSAYDINTNSNMRHKDDPYRDRCVIPYGVEDYFEFHIDDVDDTAYMLAYFPYFNDYWSLDLTCERP